MQVIYPLSTADAIAKEGLGSEVTEASRQALEQHLDQLMEAVRLSYLVTREGGWGANLEWGETLSLGMLAPASASSTGCKTMQCSCLTHLSCR